MKALTDEQHLHLLRLQIHPAPHHRAIARIAKRFDGDPAFQYKLHLAGTYIFLAQIPIVLAVSFLLPDFWKFISYTYISVISLLANAQTEACNLPSAEAAIAAQMLREKQDGHVE